MADKVDSLDAPKIKKATNRSRSPASVTYNPDTLQQVTRAELTNMRKREQAAGEAMIKSRMGRPPAYNPTLADTVCMLVVEGLSFNSIEKLDGMPCRQTLIKWLVTEEEFINKYALARRMATEIMADEMLDIADDGHNDWMARNWGNQVEWLTNGEAIARSRIRIDTRKWVMAKLQPKKWGEKLDITTDGKALPAPLLGENGAKLITDSVKQPEN